jgi:hypothetical protein
MPLLFTAGLFILAMHTVNPLPRTIALQRLGIILPLFQRLQASDAMGWHRSPWASLGLAFVLGVDNFSHSQPLDCWRTLWRKSFLCPGRATLWYPSPEGHSASGISALP